MNNIDNNIINKLTTNNCKLIKLILVILIIILIIILLVALYKLRIYCHKKNNIFLTTDKYTKFKILEDNWNTIKDEIPDFDINKISIIRDVWYGDSMDKFVNNLNDNVYWFRAQTHIDTWFNFPIMYKNKFVGNVEEICPKTCNLLKSFNNIRIAGFSLLLPNGNIDIHTDETGPTYNSMALNMPLIGKKSSLYIKPNNQDKFVKYTHINGKAVIFNSEQEHYADNKHNSYRVILYIDFNTD